MVCAKRFVVFVSHLAFFATRHTAISPCIRRIRVAAKTGLRKNPSSQKARPLSLNSYSSIPICKGHSRPGISRTARVRPPGEDWPGLSGLCRIVERWKARPTRAMLNVLEVVARLRRAKDGFLQGTRWRKAKTKRFLRTFFRFSLVNGTSKWRKQAKNAGSCCVLHSPGSAL